MQRLLFAAGWMLWTFTASAQPAPIADTLTLSLPQAEKLFLEKNLSLLAARYDVDISKALARQAGYWDNPVLNTDQNLYDGKFLRHKTVDGQSYGEIYVQLQQVIKTAGKRNKQIKLAQDAVLSSEQQLNDLLRNLKYVLTTDFNNLDQLFRTNSLYQNEIATMQELSQGMDKELQAGNISRKDDIRIRALLFSLQSDQAGLLAQTADLEKELRTLLQQNDTTVILPRRPVIAAGQPLALGALLDSARINRPDIRLAETDSLMQEHNLDYQKALVTPDLTVGMEYDKANTYVPNYWGLALSLPLPILNRNKGNIRAAKLSVQQAGVAIRQVQTQSDQEVINAWDKFELAQELKTKYKEELGEDYEHLLENMTETYRQRQVSLLEFIDFFDAYKEAALKALQEEATLNNAAAALNYTTATHVISIQ